MSKIVCRFDELVPLDTLIPYEKNRNSHSKEQIERLAKLIDYYGCRAPVIIARLVGGVPKGCMAKGHGTVLALKDLGWDSAPVVFQDFESEDELYGFVQSDNAISAWSELDLKAIHVDLPEIQLPDIDLLGIKDFEFEPDPEATGDADAMPEVPKVAKTKRGELWTLGNHRLLIDDCTVRENVALLMAGEKADMVFTDPPYNIAFEGQRISSTSVDGVKVFGHIGANSKHEKIENDSISPAEFKSFIAAFVAEMKEVNIGAWYICFAQSTLDTLLEVLRAFDMPWKSIIAWVKNQATLSNRDYKIRYEPIVYGQPGGCFFGDRGFEEDVWEIQRTLKNDLHPTMKPIPLIERAIGNSSKAGGLVFEPFCGSGSTLIAAEKTGRRCYSMELEPAYGDVILTRWAKFTGKDPVREDGVKWSELA